MAGWMQGAFGKGWIAAVFLGLAVSGCGQKSNSRAVEDLQTRLERLEMMLPGPGEVMMGVQEHFAKLYFAGKAQNWDLARFELEEVEENLDRVVQLRPKENGVDLGAVADAFKQTELKALRVAADQRDTTAFLKSYGQAVDMCNGCHAATGRPFIEITTPTSPPVSNQRWAPPAQK